MNPSNSHLSISAMVCFAAALLIAIIVIASSPTTAQDTAPAWEYAVLAYEDGSAFAFSGNLEANNELNKVFDAMGDGLNNVLALNVMGDEGWELVHVQPGTLLVYTFKRLE